MAHNDVYICNECEIVFKLLFLLMNGNIYLTIALFLSAFKI